MGLTARQQNKLLKGVYNGNITRRSLPVNYYKDTANEFMGAAKKGFGVVRLTETSKAFEVLSEVNENVHMFSAAKTYQMVRELEQVKTLADTFAEYRDIAEDVYSKYSETWKNAEMDVVLAQSMNIQKWEQIQEDKDVLPNLRYSAVIDANTSDICTEIDGTVLPVDDPFWETFSPQNHYGCRCILIQEGEDVKLTTKGEAEQIGNDVDEKMQDFFKTNVGETKQIFNSDHPYFQEIQKDDVKYAERNFDLPIPEL